MKDSFRDKVRRVWSSWVILLVPPFGLFLAIFFSYGRWSPFVNIVTGLVAAALVTFHWTRRQDQSVKATELGPPQPKSIALTELMLAEDYIVRTYRPNEIEYCVRLLTQLPDCLTRVDEDMRIESNHVQCHTKLTFRGVRPVVASTVVAPSNSRSMEVANTAAPDGDQDTGSGDTAGSYEAADNSPRNLLVPAVRARKGLLFDRFRVYDADGRTMPTLPQWQVYGLMVVTVRTLFERAVAESPGHKGNVELTESDRLIILQIVKNTACAISNPGESEDAIEDRLELIDSLDETRISPSWKTLLKSFCRSLVKSYVIVVEAVSDPGDHIILQYEHRIEMERTVRKRESILRAKHGLLPEDFDIPVSAAFQTDSYHLTVSPSVNGTYVYDHHLEELKSRRRLQQADFGRHWYVRLYFEDARSLAHLYIRKQATDMVPDHKKSADGREPAPKFGDFKSIIRFREVPPGGLGTAVTVAFVTALMVTYFAIFRVGIDPDRDLGINNTSSDVAVLILSVPALLAGAVGRGMSADRLVSASIAAFYGLWVVVITSLAAVLLFILSANRRLPWEIQGAGGFHFNGFWLLLTAFSIATYLHLRRRKNEQREYYLKCLHGDQRARKSVRDTDLDTRNQQG